VATISDFLQGATGALGAELGKLATTLAASTVHLTVAPFVPAPGSLPSDLTANEVTLAGYTPGAITTFQGPFRDQSGQNYYVSDNLVFQSTDATGVSVSGGWVASTGGSPYAVFAFNPPLLLAGPTGASIVMQVDLTGVITGRVEVVA